VAETVIQSVYRYEFDAAMRLAAKGDENAAHFLASIWDAYAGTTIACFTCNSDIDGAPKTQVLPEQLDIQSSFSSPYALRAGQDPSMARLNACIAILKEMYARRGKQVHFNFLPKRTMPSRW